MKLDFIELAGFRGFRDVTRFDLPTGFAILTGRNGAGKSTVLDAFDFVFTGTLNKYTVQQARGGGLAEHIWWAGDTPAEENYVKVGFIHDDGTSLVVSRTRAEGLNTRIEDLIEAFCAPGSPPGAFPSTFLTTTLIRDELIASLSLDLPGQARFNAVRGAMGEHQKASFASRVESVEAEALRSKKSHETHAEELQLELGRLLTAFTEARSAAEQQPDIAEALNIVASLVPQISLHSPDVTAQVRAYIADRKQLLTSLQSAISQFEQVERDRHHFQSEAGVAELELALQHAAAALAAKQADEAQIATFEHELAQLRVAHQADARMAELLHLGELIGLQHDRCPLCSSLRTTSELNESIAVARQKLGIRSEAISSVQSRLEALRTALAVHHEQSAIASGHIANLRARADAANTAYRNMQAALSSSDLSSDVSTSQDAHRQVLGVQEATTKLERAMFILDASSAHDQMKALQSRIDDCRARIEDETIKTINSELAAAICKQASAAVESVANDLLKEQFETVLPLFRELYSRLRPHVEWREIHAEYGGSVRATLNFLVGDGRNPQFMFSSGQRRAAGIAFLLAIHLSRTWCRLRSLLLDDPMQHIDDYRALNLVEVLSAIRRSDRQVIVAVEDISLAELLCRRLRSDSSSIGRYFEIATLRTGAAAIVDRREILPLPRRVLDTRNVA